MNKLVDLIQQACPSGVDTVALGDVIEDLRTGLNPRANFQLNTQEARNHYVTVRELNGFGLSITDKTDRVNDDGLKLILKRSRLKKGDVLFSGTGTIGRTSLVNEDPTNWGIKEGVYAITPVHEKLNSRYLIYVLTSPSKLDRIKELADGSTVASISMASLRKLELQLPPLEIQKEIVRILDTFTELEAELGAELEVRKIQYQYFCDTLLAFKDDETEELAVKEVCQISRGTVISKDYLRDHPGEFPVYSSQTLNNGIFGYIDTFAYDFESLTWTTDGANAGSIFFHQNEKFTITNVCGLLQVLDHSRVSARYLYYVLRAEAPKHVSAGMGNPKLMAGTMGDVILRIPSLERQLEIVEILDKFDALLNDISVGLPAEISARKQQYEYYRNRILTFSEVDVV